MATVDNNVLVGKVFNFMSNRCFMTFSDLLKKPSPLATKLATKDAAVMWIKENLSTDKRFDVHEDRGKIISVKIVSKVRLCSHYVERGKCSVKGSCRFWHVCKDYIEGNCGNPCGRGLSHDFHDAENGSKTEELGFGKLESGAVRRIVALNLPQVCPAYMLACVDSNCPYLHLCAGFVKKTCFNMHECNRSRNLRSDHNKSVLKKYGLNPSLKELYILCNILLPKKVMAQNTPANNIKTKQECDAQPKLQQDPGGMFANSGATSKTNVLSGKPVFKSKTGSQRQEPPVHQSTPHSLNLDVTHPPDEQDGWLSSEDNESVEVGGSCSLNMHHGNQIGVRRGSTTKVENVAKSKQKTKTAAPKKGATSQLHRHKGISQSVGNVGRSSGGKSLIPPTQCPPPHARKSLPGDPPGACNRPIPTITPLPGFKGGPTRVQQVERSEPFQMQEWVNCREREGNATHRPDEQDGWLSSEDSESFEVGGSCSLNMHGNQIGVRRSTTKVENVAKSKQKTKTAAPKKGATSQLHRHKGISQSVGNVGRSSERQSLIPPTQGPIPPPHAKKSLLGDPPGACNRPIPTITPLPGFKGGPTHVQQVDRSQPFQMQEWVNCREREGVSRSWVGKGRGRGSTSHQGDRNRPGYCEGDYSASTPIRTNAEHPTIRRCQCEDADAVISKNSAADDDGTASSSGLAAKKKQNRERKAKPKAEKGQHGKTDSQVNLPNKGEFQTCKFPEKANVSLKLPPKLSSPEPQRSRKASEEFGAVGQSNAAEKRNVFKKPGQQVGETQPGPAMPSKTDSFGSSVPRYGKQPTELKTNVSRSPQQPDKGASSSSSCRLSWGQNDNENLEKAYCDPCNNNNYKIKLNKETEERAQAAEERAIQAEGELKQVLERIRALERLASRSSALTPTADAQTPTDRSVSSTAKRTASQASRVAQRSGSHTPRTASQQ